MVVRSWRLLAISCLTALSGVALAEGSCRTDYEAAGADFNFVAHIDRWGQQDRDYGLGDSDRVGNIYVNSLPIFDTTSEDEDKAVFRFANRIHTMTRPRVIRNLLLFKEDGTITRNDLAESERLLRQQRYLGDAAIRTVSRCDGVVDVEVITREAWTLVPVLKLKTSGGQTETAVGFHDSNFLGRGSRVSMSLKQEAERDRIKLSYDDENFRGKRIDLGVHLEDNSDGYLRDIRIARPFYELDARRAWGLRALQSQQFDYQYALGEEVSAVETTREAAEASRGFSRGLVGGATTRFTYGLAFEQVRYRPTGLDPAPAAMPDDLQLAYPFIEYAMIEDNFGVAYNMNQIKRTEDLHFGRSARARFGLSVVDDPRLVFDGALSDTFTSRAKEIFQAHIDWRGRLNVSGSRLEDTRVTTALDFYRGQTERRSLYLGLSATRTWNLSPEKQIILGGASGLRGYPIHFSSGDTSLLLTAEQRYYSRYTLFSLFNLGYVAFADVGKTSGALSPEFEMGWLADVGFGIRLVPAKTDKSHVVHFDIAWPLRKFEGASAPQFLVEIKQSL